MLVRRRCAAGAAALGQCTKWQWARPRPRRRAGAALVRPRELKASVRLVRLVRRSAGTAG
eukprot:scaffold75525_cov69-Phaeocystis_antarctica.AAC.5